ncbi:MAG: hypothetical protein AAB460_02495 [Patescibacteria group bacterium]
MDRLSKLFGGNALVRIARLFLLHPSTGFKTQDVRDRADLSASQSRNALATLSGAGVIKRRGSKLVLDERSPLLSALRDLLVGNMVQDANLLRRLERAGTIKLLIAAGTFTGNTDSPTDLLIVGDRMNPKSLEKIIGALEADVGTEVRYAAFTTKEFSYRMGVNDKLIRDLLDYPHVKLVNKIL